MLKRGQANTAFEVMLMVTESTRSAIWQDMLDSERYYRYYGQLADRYTKIHYAIRILLLVMVIAEATLSGFLLIGNEDWQTYIVWSIVGCAVLLAIFIPVDVVFNFGQAATALGWISGDCSFLNLRYQHLWQDIESDIIDEYQARKSQRDLMLEYYILTSRFSVLANRKINKKSQEDANRVLEDRYAT